MGTAASLKSRRRLLGEFLRSRRQALSPESVGIPVAGLRRTPGLRREEVAARAGIGQTWYTWLEQGRVSTSGQVIDAIARALVLSEEAHAHLRLLAGLSAPSGVGRSDERILSLRRVVERWIAGPAFLRTHDFELIAWNGCFRKVYYDPDRLAPDRRNLVLHMFTHAEYRDRLDDWEVVARGLLSHFRLELAKEPESERFGAIVDELLQTSAEFREWWPAHSEVGTFSGVPHSILLDNGESVSLDLVQLSSFDEAPVVLGLEMPVAAADEVALRAYVAGDD
jgi:transcriptional regulator with XRE-family HTH domain